MRHFDRQNFFFAAGSMSVLSGSGHFSSSSASGQSSLIIFAVHFYLTSPVS